MRRRLSDADADGRLVEGGGGGAGEVVVEAERWPATFGVDRQTALRSSGPSSSAG